ncbi:MAG: Gfo/Idh/MocA family oxidoreductase [Candidatus Kapabacteria bacterium]|nr:Gfo/Idh/MocA family oxidoreductase [Candidatus Kapabacteria bacterium]
MKINVGVIGCGYWGPNLVRNFNSLPNAIVQTVSDTRPGRLEFIRQQYSEIHTTLEFQEVLDNPAIHAVAIATPVATHAELATLALKAGKHVFVEKPLTSIAADAWNLVELAKSLNKVLAVGHVFQFAPGVRKLHQEISAGKVGKVFHISSNRINPGPPGTTVDVVWDLCPHDLSIILHLANEMPVEISAVGNSYQWEGLVDNAHISMTFPSGTTAHIHVSWLSANKSRLLQVFAQHGTLVYDEMLALDGKVKFFSNPVDNRIGAKDSDAQQLFYSAGEISVLPLEQHEPLRMECDSFIQAILHGRSLPNDGAMGAKVVELLSLISSSISAQSTIIR